MIREVFFKFYRLVQRIIVPELKFSQYLYEEILKLYIHPKSKWLDLGCGHQLLPKWRSEAEIELIKSCREIVGVDLDLESLQKHRNLDARVRGDITELPFTSDTFDIITANMVVEHLKNPKGQLMAISRVLKPGGVFLFHTPNALCPMLMAGRLVPAILKKKLIYLLEGRNEQDVYETYYRINTRKKIRFISKLAGFEILKIKMIVTSPLFVGIPPLLIPELIWLRILMEKPFKAFRPNIIAILKKQE